MVSEVKLTLRVIPCETVLILVLVEDGLGEKVGGVVIKKIEALS